MSAVLTPEQLHGDLRRISEGLDQAVRPALERGAKAIAGEAIENLSRRGIGRRLQVTDPQSLERQIVVSELREGIEIVAKGFAGLMESGGRTSPHPIEAKREGPKGKRLLSFRASGGKGAVFSLRHPGSRVRKDPVVDPAIKAHGDKIEREILDAVDAHVRRG